MTRHLILNLMFVSIALAPLPGQAQSCNMKNVSEIVKDAVNSSEGKTGLTMQTDLQSGNSRIVSPQNAEVMTTTSQFHKAADEALARGQTGEARDLYQEAAKNYRQAGDLPNQRKALIFSDPEAYADTVQASEVRSEYSRLTALSKAPADEMGVKYYSEQIAYRRAMQELGTKEPTLLGVSDEAQLENSFKLEKEISDLENKLRRFKK